MARAYNEFSLSLRYYYRCSYPIPPVQITIILDERHREYFQPMHIIYTDKAQGLLVNFGEF